MKTLCLIHSYPGATNTLLLLWPGFKSLGWDLVGVETIDGDHFWPEPIPTIKIGRNVHWQKDRRSLPIRMVNSFAYFLTTDYDRCMIVEYDTHIIGPLPEWPAGLVTNHIGGQMDGCDAKHLFHTPWYCDRETAAKIVEYGTALIREGACEKGHHGSPDVFLSLVVERGGIKFSHSDTFSANTISGSPYVENAREAFKNGCRLFHGVKTRAQLESFTT